MARPVVASSTCVEAIEAEAGRDLLAASEAADFVAVVGQLLLDAGLTDQIGAADGSESVDGLWITPAQAIADGTSGKRTLVPATRMNLSKISPFETVAQAMAATRASKVVTVQPQVERRPDGRLVRIPAEAGYGVSEYFVATGQPTASGKA